MGCRSLPETWGMFMHGVHKSVPNLEHINEIPKWFLPDLDNILQGMQNLPYKYTLIFEILLFYTCKNRS